MLGAAELVEREPENTFFQFVSGIWRMMSNLGDACKVTSGMAGGRFCAIVLIYFRRQYVHSHFFFFLCFLCRCLVCMILLILVWLVFCCVSFFFPLRGVRQHFIQRHTPRVEKNSRGLWAFLPCSLRNRCHHTLSGMLQLLFPPRSFNDGNG